MSGSNNQFCQFFNSAAPQQQPAFPTSQPPQRSPGVDALVDNLEYSFIDIPELVGEDDDECVEPAPSPQQAPSNFPQPAAAPGVVGQVPSGFNPTLYQQYLHQGPSHIPQSRQAQQQQQQQAQQQQPQQLWAQQPFHQGPPVQGFQQR
ncbi:hypothetical protein N2152v2_007026 [Parachlorella kessleri]